MSGPDISVSTYSITIPLINEKDTIQLGHNLASILKCGDCVTLSGEIGSGKTFLARSIIRFLLKKDNLEVLSPTFTILQIYESKIPIAHFDFYRLSNIQDFFELGFDELLSEGICIVEWPDVGKELLPSNRICIQLDQENIKRKATISAEKWIIDHIMNKNIKN
ncbi:hypothetical protein G653_01207 [Candidatus Liberibacter americanus PW_SP]|nr:hypothetical protein G653_01207 [Candidatus Liberibacter americanus PW_SP]